MSGTSDGIWGLLTSCHVVPTMDGNTELSLQALKRKKQLCPDLEKRKKNACGEINDAGLEILAGLQIEC